MDDQRSKLDGFELESPKFIETLEAHQVTPLGVSLGWSGNEILMLSRAQAYFLFHKLREDLINF